MDLNTGQTNISGGNQGQLTAAELVTAVNYLLLIGAIPPVISSEDNSIITSVFIKLIAGFLAVGAALVESKEQQISPGVTTPLNRMKTIGSVVSIIGALILTYVILNEISLRRAGIRPPTPQVPPFISPAFL